MKIFKRFVKNKILNYNFMKIKTPTSSILEDIDDRIQEDESDEINLLANPQ